MSFDPDNRPSYVDYLSQSCQLRAIEGNRMRSHTGGGGRNNNTGNLSLVGNEISRKIARDPLRSHATTPEVLGCLRFGNFLWLNG